MIPPLSPIDLLARTLDLGSLLAEVGRRYGRWEAVESAAPRCGRGDA